MFTEKELLQRLQINRKTLYIWRLQGLPFVHAMGMNRYLYDLNKVTAWALKNNKKMK